MFTCQLQAEIHDLSGKSNLYTVFELSIKDYVFLHRVADELKVLFFAHQVSTDKVV
jgi:hypothetical protein